MMHRGGGGGGGILIGEARSVSNGSYTVGVEGRDDGKGIGGVVVDGKERRAPPSAGRTASFVVGGWDGISVASS